MTTQNTDSDPLFPSVTVHVDTSLLIEQLKEDKKSKPVKDALAKYVFKSTSTYARKEFKQAWLQDLGWLYKVSRECDRIEEVYDRITKSFWLEVAKRRLSRCMDAMKAFMSRQSPNLPLGAVMAKLRSSLAEMILGGVQAWERNVTHEYTGTRCVRAIERPIRAEDESIDVTVKRCKQAKIQCTVHEFFESNQHHFDAIDKAITAQGAAASKELSKTSKTIQLAMKNPKVLCDIKNCSAMGDAIIAVDGVKTDHFAANNPKEWDTIAGALGKPLHNPVALAKKVDGM